MHADHEWQYVLTLLPSDIQESARQSNALVRCRNVPNAEALIRLALAYAVSDLSMKDVAAWAHALGLAELTGPGLFYRLREAEPWLQGVLAQTLQDEVEAPSPGLRLRVVDATVVNGPGATGTEWRAHVLVDPASGCMRAVELTDSHGGEGYARHPIQAGEIVLGDRAYATARGIHAVRLAGAHVLVRLNPHTLRLCDVDRRVIDIRHRSDEVPAVGGLECDCLVPVPPETTSKSHRSWPLTKAIAWVTVRVVAGRTRKGEIIWILTTAPRDVLPPWQAMDLYRFRWQIELLFKRLKSLLHLDTLPSRQGPTAKTWMLARFIAAALAERLVRPAGPLSPWGYALREAGVHP